MSWFNRPTPEYISIKQPEKRERIGKDIWHKCDQCNSIVRQKEWIQNWKVCTSCNHHDRISAADRIKLFLDADTFKETNAELVSGDPLKFTDSKKYTDRVVQAREKTGRNDAVVTGTGKIYDVPVSLAVMEFAFMGGSMGSVVGEKIARSMEKALDDKCPCITVASTGGARMQEGVLSLMQLAKTSMLCKKMNEQGIPFISVLADPSTAGIMASFASLGDVIIAEPGAYVGFAGKRVIKATTKQSLPKGFQTSEFVHDRGFIDLVIHRHDLRSTIGTLLRQLNGMSAIIADEDVESNEKNETKSVAIG